MKRFLVALLLWPSLALAQTTFTMPPPAGVILGGYQVVTSCGSVSLTANQLAFGAMDTTGTICSAAGGGSGGLSVTDQAAFTQGTSKFTPGGGVFNDTATLSSGQEGTFRMTTKRGQIVDVDATGNQLHSDLIAPIPAGTNLIGKTGIDQTTQGTTNGVTNGAHTYQHIAASQTAAVLQTSTGAIGDYLSHCVIYPSTTAAGSVTVFDNANAAATNVIEFATGTLSNLAPIAIPVGAVSTAGAWKVTTGANETVVCYGKFS